MTRIEELEANIKCLKATIKQNCWNQGYVINSRKTLQAYEDELATLTA